MGKKLFWSRPALRGGKRHWPFNAAIVVGHSMGSIVAQQIAIDHPDQVKPLVY